MYKLSNRSQGNLTGVHPKLIAVVERAIEITNTDFGVIEGVRNIETQRDYVKRGVSQTMNSKHLIQPDGYSHAVDLMAYVGIRGSWEMNLYDNIADAIKQAAQEYCVSLKWGACWHIDNIVDYEGTMQEATDEYVRLRIKQGRRPFIDGPHFELS